jgi:hypothetical protein
MRHLTRLEARVLGYLASLDDGAWASTSEVARQALPDYEAQGKGDTAARVILIELVRAGHVCISDQSDGEQETWKQIARVTAPEAVN